MQSVKEYIEVNSEVLSGAPVFKGTRVPVESLFMHLEDGVSVDEFLSDFPTVSKEQALAVLEIAQKIMSSANIEKLYEAAA